MPEYNKAFFGTHETYFKVLKETYSLEEALKIFTEIMERNLGQAYDSMGFEKGKPEDFAQVLKERDNSVGLEVSFPEVSENKIVYRFHTDPFPGLKGEVDPRELDSTYMNFKVRYLLGEDWSYKTSKHIWEGDKFTEHVIVKLNNYGFE